MPSRKTARPTLPATPDPRFCQARQELQQLGYFLKGTVLTRMMKCGQPNCACHQDASQRHGPYFEWTYKVKGKTVNVKLSPQAAPALQSRHQTAPQTQGRAIQHGASVADCFSPLGQASRRYRLNRNRGS